MIRRSEDLAQTIREIEAHHAARRARGKLISAGAIARLEQLREELKSPPRAPSRASGGGRLFGVLAAVAAVSGGFSPPPMPRGWPQGGGHGRRRG